MNYVEHKKNSMKLKIKVISIYLPFSHLSPSKPGGQTQVVFATPSMHVPPFKHGKNISVPFDNAAISGSLVQHLEYLHLSIFNDEKIFWNALAYFYILYKNMSHINHS